MFLFYYFLYLYSFGLVLIFALSSLLSLSSFLTEKFPLYYIMYSNNEVPSDAAYDQFYHLNLLISIPIHSFPLQIGRDLFSGVNLLDRRGSTMPLINRMS